MAFTKIAAAGIGSTETVTLHSLEVLNNATVGGVLTYEDVTNVDSVGLITARAGIVVGSGITLSKDGDIFATGVTTSTSFVGDGSQLTGVASTENIRTNTNATFLQNINVSGTSTVGGAIFADADLFMVDSLRHTGDTDTKIRFPSADTITFETAGSEGARIDSSGRMILGGSASFADVNSDDFQIEGDANTGMIIKSGTSHYGSIYFGDGTSGDSRNRGIVRYNHTNDSMELWANTSERLRIDSSGRLLVATDTATGAAKLQLLQSTGDALLVRNHDTNYEGIILSNESGEARLMATSGGSTARPALTFFTGDSERLRITSGGDILSSASTQLFGANTSDGSDNKSIMINGGGATSDTRGGYLIVYGNEHASNPGMTRLHAGNVGTAGIEFYTAGSKRMTIDSNGYVTKPALPSFSAHTTATRSADAEAVFNVVVTNIGSHYNTSNGRFTAPVAGNYYFSFHGMGPHATSQNARCYFMVNGSSHPSGQHYGGVAYAGGHSGGYTHISMDTILPLSANDTVSVYWQYMQLHSEHSKFNGFLIG